MIKLVTSNAHSGPSLPLSPHSVARSVGISLEKRSDAQQGQLDFLEKAGRIDPRIRQWIANAPIDFGKHAYVIVVPLGADESWEETVNGDAFARDQLAPENPEWGHKTFEGHAKAFMNHRNSDPTKGFGDLPCAVYNYPMDRVEGIWRLDRDLAKQMGATDVIRRADSGGPIEISMGCRVKFDICSLCGNEAKSVRDYCDCVRNPGFGHIDSLSGKKMRVFNPQPLFFDLSDVHVPAAPEAHSLGILDQDLLSHICSMEKSSAARHFILPSAVLGARRWGVDFELLGGTSKVSSAPRPVKVSDLIKEVPMLEAHVIRPMQDDEPELDLEKVKESNPTTLLSSLAGLGIVCTPREFAKIAFPDERVRITPDRVSQVWPFASSSSGLITKDGIRPGIMSAFSDCVPDRSVFYPYLGQRAVKAMHSGAQVTPTTVEFSVSIKTHDAGAALMYASYLKTLAHSLGSLLSQVFRMYPDHAASNLGIGSLTKDSAIRKAATVNDFASSAVLPSAYILSHAGIVKSAAEVESSMKALHVPGVEHWFGGLLTAPI